LDKELSPGYLADLARLRQILLNLVGNAIKFTQNGRVTVGVERLAREARHDWLRFSVNDTGIGIDREHAARIFEPFYQADSSASRRYEGAGLGLAICHRLVQAMQGEIGVDSQPGEGSTFWFKLRLERDRTAVAGSAPRSASAAPYALRRVLLVEDDPRNAIVLRSMLQRLSCEVTIAFDGRAAVKLFQASPFDLVLLDFYLPDMDGGELARRLRQHASGTGHPPPPVIVQTANTDASDLLAIKSAGFEGFLAKPMEMKLLGEMIDRLVPRPAPAPARRRQTRPGFRFSPGKITREK
jgi:CheY-like chemotaxis protein